MINRKLHLFNINGYHIHIERCTVTDEFILRDDNGWQISLNMGDMINFSDTLREISVGECIGDLKVCEERLDKLSAGRSLVGGSGDGGDMTVSSLVPPSPFFSYAESS